MKIKSINNPRYSRADKSAIDVDLVIEYPDGRSETMPFTATPGDPEKHGREVYAKVVRGNAEPIGDFIPRVPTIREPSERDILIEALKSKVTEEELSAAKIRLEKK